MSAATRARRARAPPFLEPAGYARHRPEATLLYQLVERHDPAFREMPAEAGRPLPDYIEQEFDAYLKCGRLEEALLRVRCETCHAEKLVAFSCKKRGFCPSCAARRMAETAALTQVLGVVTRVISGDPLKRAGLTRTKGHTGAVRLTQRFGSALNLNIHFHMLFLDGVYRVHGTGAPVFRQSEPGGRYRRHHGRGDRRCIRRHDCGWTDRNRGGRSRRCCRGLRDRRYRGQGTGRALQFAARGRILAQRVPPPALRSVVPIRLG